MVQKEREKSYVRLKHKCLVVIKDCGGYLYFTLWHEVQRTVMHVLVTSFSAMAFTSRKYVMSE